MIEKQDFEVLEQQLEQFAATRNLNSAEAKPVVDAYFQLLIDYSNKSIKFLQLILNHSHFILSFQ